MGDRLRVRDVEVVGAVGQHREAAGVGQDVAQRDPLLARAPAVDVVGDPVVEAEAALLPELQDGDGGERLARGVPEHDVVGAQGPAGGGVADRSVEQELPPQGHVDLGAVVPAVCPLPFEQIDDLGEVKSGSHDAEA